MEIQRRKEAFNSGRQPNQKGYCRFNRKWRIYQKCSLDIEQTIVANAGGYMNIVDWYTRSAVEGALNRMPKVEVPMIRRAQGDIDKTSNWAEVCHRFVTQLQVCIGDDADLSKFIDSDGNIPDCFKLDPISFNGTAWWDEAHHDSMTQKEKYLTKQLFIVSSNTISRFNLH